MARAAKHAAAAAAPLLRPRRPHLLRPLLLLLPLLVQLPRGDGAGAPHLASFRACFPERWSVSCVEGAATVRCDWQRHFERSRRPFFTAVFRRRATPDCSALRVEGRSAKEEFEVELQPEPETEVARTGALRGRGGGPRWEAQPLAWRRWVLRAAAARLRVRRASRCVPPLRELRSLRDFALNDSPALFAGECIDEIPELPEELQELELKDNALSKFPKTNNTFPMLRKLDLSENRFNNTCDLHEIGKAAPNVQVLDLSRNAFSSISCPLQKLFPKIRQLNLFDNDLQVNFYAHELPVYLNYLNLSENAFFRLPFGNSSIQFPELNILDISRPEDRVCPTNDSYFFMKAMPKLSRLYIEGYDTIHLAELNLTYLKLRPKNEKFPSIYNSTIITLDISDGHLTELVSLGDLGTRVETLNVSGNAIKTWCSASLFEERSGVPWATAVNLSRNVIASFSPDMLRSLERLSVVDVGGNRLECNNCSIIQYEQWLLRNAGRVLDLNRTNISATCYSPAHLRGRPLSESEFHNRFCRNEFPRNFGIPLIVVACFIILQGTIGYRYRFQIIFMMHMYRLRMKISSDNADGCTHDVFICYCSADRRFVLETLTPLVEAAPECYRAYVHERSFRLGSSIDANIVEAIERSRRALLVVSQAFLRSEFCRKEVEMATHRAFDGSPRYLVVLRLGPLRPEQLPRPLRLHMSTRTYLEWPEDGDVHASKVRTRLVEVLGRSLHQREQGVGAAAADDGGRSWSRWRGRTRAHCPPPPAPAQSPAPGRHSAC